MIVGAALFYKGKVFEASLVYQLPNAIYLYLGYKSQDWVSMIVVAIGVGLALLTIYKMHTGVFVKDLSEG